MTSLFPDTSGILNFIMSLLMSVFTILQSLTASSLPKQLDLSEFELVWEDDFNGDALDTSVWSGHQLWNTDTVVRKGGYWNLDFATVSDGNLHISTEYFPDGYNGNGMAGWYSCGLTSRYAVKQKYGYFEVRCILPKGCGMWSAFWLTCTGVTNVDGTGKDGAELDVFESSYYYSDNKNRVTTNIHFDGYGAEKQSENVCIAEITANNPYEEYNTYGVEWNEDEYIFYINGIETGRSSFGGTSEVEEWLMLTVEVGGADGVPKKSWAGPSVDNSDVITDFIVDYVRIYQYTEK